MNYAPNDVISGKYRLIESIGGGAMGEVFKAEHLMMHKTVAIKILHQDMSESAEIVERFKREAQSAAAIDHSNLCAVMDFDMTSDNEFYLVMEYLEGDTLLKRIKQNHTLPPGECIFILQQLLSVLQCAHDKGIVHRDVKPENVVLINKEGTNDFVKLLDFGIAHTENDAQDPEDSGSGAFKTRAGFIYGTPEYMAPEQANGRQIDYRVDLYACGIILFEMLMGHVPFESEDVINVLHKQFMEPPPHLDVANIECGEQFDAIIQKLLAKTRDDRYQSANEVIEALSQLPVSPWAPLSRPSLAVELSTLSQGQTPARPLDNANLAAEASQLMADTRQLASDLLSRGVEAVQSGKEKFKQTDFKNKTIEVKATATEFIRKMPRQHKMIFGGMIALIVLLMLIVLITSLGSPKEIEVVKNGSEVEQPELRKISNVQDFIYDDEFDVSGDETLKKDINLIKSVDAYNQKNYQEAYSHVITVNDRYRKHPNYLRLRMQIDAQIVRTKTNKSGKVNESAREVLDDIATCFVELIDLQPDAARNGAVSEAVKALFPNNKNGEIDPKLIELSKSDVKTVARGMAWTIMYSPYDDDERRKDLMFELFDSLHYEGLPDWQKRMLEAWRLDKSKCKQRQEIMQQILNDESDRETLYYGMLSPLYRAKRLDIKDKYKRYKCQELFKSYDCNSCMKWIEPTYEAWTELLNQGKLSHANLDFMGDK